MIENRTGPRVLGAATLILLLAGVGDALGGSKGGKGKGKKGGKAKSHQPTSSSGSTAPAPTPAPTPAPGAGTPAAAHAASPGLAGQHTGRAFGGTGTSRPFGNTGTGRAFGNTGTQRPFGSIGSPAPTGPLTVPVPTAGTTPPPAPLTIPGIPKPDQGVHVDSPTCLPLGPVIPNPYIELPAPSSVSFDPPVGAVNEPATVAPPAPALPPSESTPRVNRAPTPAEIDLAVSLADDGRAQLASGFDSMAEVTFDGAIRLFPGDPVFRLDHAFALLGARHAHAASMEIVRALKLDPDLIERNLNVVAPYGSREAFDQRLAHAELYTRAYPLDSYGRFLRGFLAFHLNDMTRAREEFVALHREDAEFPFAAQFAARVASIERDALLAPPPPAEVPEISEPSGPSTPMVDPPR